MKIIILGAGQVGGSLAWHLAGESSNQITVVDENENQLKALRERMDVGTVLGHGAYPDILAEAGAEDADMLVAVTNNDETNMLACQVGYTMFQTPMKIARVRSPSFVSRAELFANAAIPIDVLISPEQLLTDLISRLIQFPGTLQVLDFAAGKLQMVAVRAQNWRTLTGETTGDILGRLENITVDIAAIYRKHHPIEINTNTRIEPNDEIFFVVAEADLGTLIATLREADQPNRRIMIAGGGNVGKRAAQLLEKNYQVKIIERDLERSQHLAEQLTTSLVLAGDATDKTLLHDEYVQDTDVFCALTEDDETNIMSSILAKRMGAKKVMTLINRLAYVDLVEDGEVDVVISPQQITVSHLLKHVRRGDVVQVHALRRGAEAIEAIAHGDKDSSKVVGRKIKDLSLPHGTHVIALVRGDQVLLGDSECVIQSQDHVVLFLYDKKQIHQVEKLFQVSATFL